MQALKHGRQLYYKNQHEHTLVPGRLLAHEAGKYGHRLDPDFYMPFRTFAYPGSLSDISLSAIAAVKAYSNRKYWNKWVKNALPWDEIKKAQDEIDPPDPIALEGQGMVVFCPKIEDRWLSSPLTAFNVPEGQAGQKVTLYSLDNRRPIVTVTLHEDGLGYYTDEKFLISKEVANA